MKEIARLAAHEVVDRRGDRFLLSEVADAVAVAVLRAVKRNCSAQLLDSWLAEFDAQSAPDPLRDLAQVTHEKKEQKNDLVGDDAHGGRDDLGPAARPELSHDVWYAMTNDERYREYLRVRNQRDARWPESLSRAQRSALGHVARCAKADWLEVSTADDPHDEYEAMAEAVAISLPAVIGSVPPPTQAERALERAGAQAQKENSQSAVTDLEQATWQAITSPDRGLFLVTNNIDARNQFGYMSHVWLTRAIHVGHSATDGRFFCIDENGQRVVGLTHFQSVSVDRRERQASNANVSVATRSDSVVAEGVTAGETAPSVDRRERAISREDREDAISLAIFVGRHQVPLDNESLRNCREYMEARELLQLDDSDSGRERVIAPGEQEQEKNDHGGTSLTEVDAVSGVVQTPQLSHDERK